MPNTETHEFSSSNLASGRYEPDTAELFITFNTGRTYRYDNVGWDDWNGLCQAASAGRYFTQYIRHVFPATAV